MNVAGATGVLAFLAGAGYLLWELLNWALRTSGYTGVAIILVVAGIILMIFGAMAGPPANPHADTYPPHRPR